MIYKINFKHLVENEYFAHVEANSKEEALKKFDEDPFEYVDEEPYDEQGLEIKDIEVIN
jgi:hypothetical protein